MQQFIDVAGDPIDVKVRVHLAEMRSADVGIQILWGSNLSCVYTSTARHVIKKKITGIIRESIADGHGTRQRVDDIRAVHYSSASDSYIATPKSAHAVS